ncbi:hypothetical protein G3545_06275 [Starkeya sp. ORNL1]|uniref:hypothetical protein n=1 Tax=Starkeya sp. ORNL1 TaxID=2709380 RepID=UPI0014637878|nr:hypothetical protein [Starkeya sp. ORNL1]QJP13291.1 hypothetical protein G3545_06275 [Starkeya sp. ORNL1]
MPRRWNTGRVALYGALVGALYALLNTGLDTTSSLVAFEAFGQAIGGGAVGAVLAACGSGLRNALVMRKQGKPV